ncbi:uncharacterized protein LOC126845559 isoform X3 [Adelges cooleyi]|uniref:uncharacterized protein LOC126845559 isoform X3 n=1 Tax=Adelges cooleyi TaxID=133065 RepID=UPI00217F3713|nr:uncharacterized protein LOC126845559 isoform X3 [Adelges cooleyi]
MDFKRTLFLSTIAFVILAINSGNVAESSYSTPPEDKPEDDGYTTPTEEIQAPKPPPITSKPKAAPISTPKPKTTKGNNITSLLEERKITTSETTTKKIIQAAVRNPWMP